MWLRFKWDMFVTSFIPLWISVLVLTGWEIADGAKWEAQKSLLANARALVCENLLLLTFSALILALMIGSMIHIRVFLKERASVTLKPVGTVLSARRAGRLSSEFLLAYILPMAAFDFSEGKGWVLFAFYIAVLAFLCIRNNNVYTNIYLEFLGYKIYECDMSCRVLNSSHVYSSSLVISKINLTSEIEKEICYWDFENHIYLAFSQNRGGDV